MPMLTLYSNLAETTYLNVCTAHIQSLDCMRGACRRKNKKKIVLPATIVSMRCCPHVVRLLTVESWLAAFPPFSAPASYSPCPPVPPDPC